MECPICCETVNKLYKCGNNDCDAECCAYCHYRWFITNKVDESEHCMSCRKTIDYITVKRIMSECMKDYIAFKKEQIYNIESANIETVGCVKELFNEYVKVKIEDIRIFATRHEPFNIDDYKYKNIIDKIIEQPKTYLSHNELMKEYDSDITPMINKIEKKINELKKKSNVSNEDYNDIKEDKKNLVKFGHSLLKSARLFGNENNEVKQIILYPCPREGCLGYVLDNHVCNNCNSKVCDKCRMLEIEHEDFNEKKDEEFNKREKVKCPECKDIRDLVNHKPYVHIISKEEIESVNEDRVKNGKKEFTLNEKFDAYVSTCNRDVYETCKLITKDSRPCPKCKNYIQKTIGCDQMFCNICATCFDWQTLMILDKARVHNPELIEWRRKRGDLTIDNFQNIRCDILDANIDILLNMRVKEHPRLKKVVSYYAKSNEIKEYLENNNLRNFNNKQIESLKNFKLTCAKYAIFDMDYSRYPDIVKRVITDSTKKLKNELYEIYDDTYCLYKIEEYYQTLAQGMTDILLKLQFSLKSKDNDKKSEIEGYIDELFEWCNYMKGLIKDGIDVLKPRFKTVNIDCFV